MAYIFKHYLKTEHIFLHVDKHFDDAQENAHIKSVVEDTLHHHLLDLVLGELDETKKVHFLAHVTDETKHDGLLNDLQKWITDFDSKIDKRLKEAEEEILEMFTK